MLSFETVGSWWNGLSCLPTKPVTGGYVKQFDDYAAAALAKGFEHRAQPPSLAALQKFVDDLVAAIGAGLKIDDDGTSLVTLCNWLASAKKSAEILEHRL